MNPKYETELMRLVATKTGDLIRQQTEAEKQVQDCEGILADISKEVAVKTKPLYDEITRINEEAKPEREKWEARKNEQSQIAQNMRRRIPVEILLAKGEAAASTLTSASQMEADVFVGWLMFKHSIHLETKYSQHVELDVQKVQQLDNGVTLFRHHNGYNGKLDSATEVAYIAIKGLDVVGFQCTEKAQHRGDSATYHGWIGTDLTDEDELETKKDSVYAWNNGIQFKEWKAKVAELKEFVPIDLSKIGNKQVIASTCRSGWRKPSTSP